MAIYIEDLLGQDDDPASLPSMDPLGNPTGQMADPYSPVQPAQGRSVSPVPGLNDPEFQTPQAPVQPSEGGLFIEDLMGDTDTVPAGTPTRRPVNFFGYETPEELDFIVGPAMDTAIGVNSQLASLAAIPVDDVNSILVDMVGKGFLDKPGNAKEMFQKSMESLGIAAGKDHKAVSEFWDNVGEASANGLLMLSGLFAAAPMMAAAQGTSTSALLQQSLGKGLMEAPALAIRGELSGAVGGEYGRKATEGTPLEPLGVATGTVLGGMAGGSQRLVDTAVGAVKGATKGTAAGAALGTLTGSPEVGAALGGTAGAVKGSIRGITGGPQAEREALKAIPKTAAPMIDPNTNPQVLSAAAKSAVAGDIVQADNAIDDILKSVPNTADPLRAAERLRGGLRRAYDVAQKKAEVLWNRVDTTAEVDTQPLLDLRQAMLDDSSKYGLGKDIPGDILAQIGKMPAPGQLPPPRVGAALFGPGNAPTPKTPTINDIKKLRGVVNARLRDPAAAMTDEERRNLVILQKAMSDTMVNADPTNGALLQAREYSRWLHETFDEGPVGAFTRRRQGGPDMGEFGDMSDPGKAAQALLRREKAGSPIASAAEELDMPSLVSRSEQYIREVFGAEAAKSPEGAAKWLGKPEVKRFMQAFPKVDAEMQVVGQDLGTALTQRRTIENSAFTKFSKEEPQVALNRVWNSGNKVKDAREITARLNDDPDAMAAWRAGNMEELIRGTKNSPSAIRDRLASKDTGPMLREVFGDAQFARIQKNINDAAELELHGESLSTRLAKRGVSIGSRLLGLKIASTISSGGPGSLQTAALIGKATENMTTGFTKALQPDVLLARALIDPAFERVLWTKAPQNLKDATAMTDQMRRVVTSLQAGNSAFSTARNRRDE